MHGTYVQLTDWNIYSDKQSKITNYFSVQHQPVSLGPVPLIYLKISEIKYSLRHFYWTKVLECLRALSMAFLLRFQMPFES